MVSSRDVSNANSAEKPILSTREAEFSYFDMLPQTLRERLNNALFPFSSQEVYTQYRRYGEKHLLRMIESREQKLRAHDPASSPHR